MKESKNDEAWMQGKAFIIDAVFSTETKKLKQKLKEIRFARKEIHGVISRFSRHPVERGKGSMTKSDAKIINSLSKCLG